MSTTTATQHDQEVRDDVLREQELRKQAIDRIEKRRDFWTHVTAYVVVNALLTGIWFVTNDGDSFWPIFPLLGWGIGLVFHALDVYRSPVTEERIQHEMRRFQGYDTKN
jgi:hypothetical protein